MKIIIYHHNDEDGWTSAAIILKKYPEAELIPCYHGNKYDFVKDYDKVFVVDFTFSSDEMNQLKNNNKEFVWIDHHISAMKKVQGEFVGIQQEGTAACKLCWEYFFPEEKIPKLVEFVNGLDIWDFSKKGTKEFANFLDSELELETEAKQIL
ncbi:MAG: DHH family phosphoesterase, partial [Patescibacteria group bacterium]|nr:DHH family phosphoesterase [Patescibacteria group bacterium]